MGPACSYEIFATQRQRDTEIRMKRTNLEDLPPLDLPKGYVCRPMQADEVWAYLHVLNRSTHSGGADREWFQKAFASDPGYDPSYVQIIWKDKDPVAAATGWHDTIDGEEWGKVHWVGVVAEERHKGLGTAAALASLHVLQKRGFQQAMLDTQLWRMPAIATYLGLGFESWPTKAAPEALWETILDSLAEWREQHQKSS